MNVPEADAQEPGEHRLGERQQRLGVDVQRAGAFRRLDGVARGAVIERRKDDEVHLLLEQDLEDAGDGERVHSDRHVLTVIFKNPERQDDGPAGFDRRANLVGQHQFEAHGPSSHSLLQPLAALRVEQVNGVELRREGRNSPGRAVIRSRKTGDDLVAKLADHLRFRACRFNDRNLRLEPVAEEQVLGPNAIKARLPSTPGGADLSGNSTPPSVTNTACR